MLSGMPDVILHLLKVPGDICSNYANSRVSFVMKDSALPIGKLRGTRTPKDQASSAGAHRLNCTCVFASSELILVATACLIWAALRQA